MIYLPKVKYMNKADKSDPLNQLRVFFIVWLGRYIKLTWGCPELEWGAIHMAKKPTP